MYIVTVTVASINRSAKKYFGFFFVFWFTAHLTFKVEHFLTVYYHRGPFCQVPCIATQPKKSQKGLWWSKTAKKNWPRKFTVSRSNKPTPSFQEKSDIYICRSVYRIWPENWYTSNVASVACQYIITYQQRNS